MLKMIFHLQVTSLKIKYNPFAKAFLDAKERTETPGACHRDSNQEQSSYSDCNSSQNSIILLHLNKITTTYA